MTTPAEYAAEARDRYQAMHERAVERVAIRIKTVLADQWHPLKEAGWSNDDIRVILDQAIEQCNSQP